MPFDRVSLAAMVAVENEFVDKEQIAERFGVSLRTVERLIEANAKALRKQQRRKGPKVLYLWSEVLRCAKIHVGLDRDNAPSVSTKRAYRKQRIHDLEADVERLREFQAIQYENIAMLKQILNQKTCNKSVFNQKEGG